jgi:hypothetical protein
MARRQPYRQAAPMGAPSDPAEENTLQPLEDGGLQIDLSDVIASPDKTNDDPAPQPEETAPAPTVREPERTADDEAFAKLKAQLERSERERLETQNRLGRVEQERSTVEGDLRSERERAEQMRREHLAAQELAIDNAMRVAEREAAAAEEGIQRALEAADYQTAAKLQRTLNQADNDLVRLREGKNALSQQGQQQPAPRKEQPAQETQAARPSVPQNEWEQIEAYITQPSHPPRVQAYMRDHYDDLFKNGGARVNKLVAAHYEAKAEGLPDFSDEYFKKIDRYMGYDKSTQAPAPNEAAPAPQRQQQRTIPPAAPVTRGAPNNQVSGTSITLTPEQVKFCRESGIDPKAYARQILVINQGKGDPNYTGPRWTSDMGN